MRAVRMLVAALAACGALTACGDTDHDVTSMMGTRAQMQFVNAMTDAPAVNFAVNGQAAVQNVGFGTPSTCSRFAPGMASLAALDAAAATPFAGTVDVPLSIAGRFTVIATGASANPRLLVLSDASTPVANGGALLRVVNAVPAEFSSDVFVSAPNAALNGANATNIGFNMASGFIEVPAGETQIRFTRSGSQDMTFTGDPFSLSAGQTRTVIVAPGREADTFRSFAVSPC